MTEFDAETVDVTPTVEGGPVDQPGHPVTFGAIIQRAEHRKPIVPAALRSRDQRRQLGQWAVRFGAHTAAYHATRSPKYAAKVLVWAPVGVFVGLARLLRWLFDTESWSLRQEMATRNDAEAYLRLSRQRDRRVGLRLWAVLPAAVVVVVGLVLLLTVAPHWWRWPALAGALPVLAWVGRPADKPLTDRVTVGQRFIKLTAEMTRAAIVAAGAGVKDPSAVKFPRDIGRAGPGWSALVDLPPGIVATDVIDKRDRLAAGLRLPKSQVWPSTVDGEHPGRLEIWVADKPVSTMRQPEWPLLHDGQVDYFKPFPFGFDERMRPVTWRLDERNSLLAGIPGSGKSLAVRVLALAGILDPLVIPVIFELKGSGDFDPIESLCPPRLYGSGADDGTKRAAMAALEWLSRECDTRGPLVKDFARRGLTTENKVSRVMAERDDRLRPILAIVDEVQELFTDPDLGKHAVAIATSVVKRGRALGIHLVLASQRIDSASIPRGISSNMGVRFCMAVTSHIEADLVLGTGAYSRGARPTEFEPGPDSGWGWRAGIGRTAPCRAAYLDNAAAAAVVARAKHLRFVTDVPVVPRLRVRNLAADVRQVWPVGATGWWLADILGALQQLDQAYADMDTAALSAALRAAGIKPVPIHRKIRGEAFTRHGVQLADLTAAIADSQARAIDSGSDIGPDLPRQR